MNPISKYTVGSALWLDSRIIYAILLFCRFRFFAQIPTSFFHLLLASYFLFSLCFLYAGIARKKELGGFADMREIFQSIFISILITELYMYYLFSLYMKFSRSWFCKSFPGIYTCLFSIKQDLAEKDMDMQNEGNRIISDDQLKPAGLVKGFGTAVVIDSIFGFIFAIIFGKQNQ